MAKVTNINGKLYVVEDWQNDWSKPVQYQTAWPTGIKANDYEQLINEPCTYVEAGLYRLPLGLLLRLEHGGETKSDKSVEQERPIPKPKNMKVYRDGQWHKF